MKRNLGQYYTVGNPFEHAAFIRWLSSLPTNVVLEPFAGSMNIPSLLKPHELVWHGYDISPGCPGVVQQDTLTHFPEGFQVVITNPPYLAKNSATRLGMSAEFGGFDDLYKRCLDLMLSNCDYVAAIVPNSFLTSEVFTERLTDVISLPQKMFDDTDCPSCLALFSSKPSSDFDVYKQHQFLGKYSALKAAEQSFQTDVAHDWVFNDSEGYIGLRAVDSTKGKDVMFVPGETVPSGVKPTNRSWTRISGPRVDGIIEKANKILSDYRNQTHDVFLTSFRGTTKQNDFRRRLSWDKARLILNLACK